MRVPYRILAKLAVVLTIGVVAAPACDEDTPTGTPPNNDHVAVVQPDGRGEYRTIQDAIDAVASGDTVELTNGTFRGAGNRDLNVHSKELTLRSQLGSAVSCVIDCDGSSADPHRAFEFTNADSLTVTISNLSISNGWGIGGGGAISAEGPGTRILRGLEIRSNGNSAVDCVGANMLLEGCLFDSNPDGALGCWNLSDIEVRDCRFIANRSDNSGGGIYNASSILRVRFSTFERNSAGFSGGAIVSYSITDESAVTISDCLFQRNTAGYHAGAIDLSNSDYRIENCTFVANAAPSNGGAVWSYRSAGTIESCVFYGNEGGKGGVLNCGWNSSPDIRNTIIAFNSGSAPVACDTLLGPAQPTFHCSDIYENYGGDWTGCISSQADQNGNISADPMFCDVLAGDFRLDPQSPCAQPPCGRMGPWNIGCNSVME